MQPVQPIHQICTMLSIPNTKGSVFIDITFWLSTWQGTNQTLRPLFWEWSGIFKWNTVELRLYHLQLYHKPRFYHQKGSDLISYLISTPKNPDYITHFENEKPRFYHSFFGKNDFFGAKNGIFGHFLDIFVSFIKSNVYNNTCFWVRGVCFAIFRRVTTLS